MSVTTATRTAPQVRVRHYPLTEPDGLTDWRRTLGPPPTRYTPTQSRAILEAVRAHQPLGVVTARTGLTRTQVLDVVAGVGGRLGQMLKSGPRPAAQMSAARGARVGLAPGVHPAPNGPIVVLADGWAHSRGEPRKVSRPYATIAVASAEQVEAAMDRWLTTTQCTPEVTYHLLAHLYAVSRGALPTLRGVSEDPEVQRVYVRGYDLLVATIRQGHQDLATALDPTSAPVQVREAVVAAFWLCGSHAPALVAATYAGDVTLRRAQRLLRTHVERAPRVFFPRAIGNLTRGQFMALCASLGVPLPADEVADEPETGGRLLAALTVRV